MFLEKIRTHGKYYCVYGCHVNSSYDTLCVVKTFDLDVVSTKGQEEGYDLKDYLVTK